MNPAYQLIWVGEHASGMTNIGRQRLGHPDPIYIPMKFLFLSGMAGDTEEEDKVWEALKLGTRYLRQHKLWVCDMEFKISGYTHWKFVWWRA